MDAWLVGQDRVVRALTSAMKADRLAHGLLFLGPSGVGRETAARGLASGLLCDARGTVDERLPFGCGTCRSCRRARNGQHPDVVVVMSDAERVARGLAEPDGKAKPSAEIRIEAVRELGKTLHQRPYEGRARIAIVVDAHKMNERSQNALLKGLEEPGAQTVLILLAPGERALLPTIASRCLRLTFSPLRPDALAAVLRRNGVVDADDRARSGATSLTTAIADAGAHAASATRLLEALAWAAQGVQSDARLDVAEQLGRDRLEVDAVLAQVERWLAAGLRRRYGLDAPPPPLDLAADEAGVLRCVARARDHLHRNGAVQLVVEELLFARQEAS